MSQFNFMVIKYEGTEVVFCWYIVVTYEGIVEHEESTKLYVGIVEHTRARMSKM